jgi:hypothetical protein
MSSNEMLEDMEFINRDVSETLAQLQVRYWLDSGTLLGAYRFKAFLPYDDDVDFGLMREDFEQHQAAIKASLSHKGYVLTGFDSDPNGEVIPQIYFAKNGAIDHERTHLDFFLFEALSENPKHLRLSSETWHRRARHAGVLGFPRRVIFNSDGSLGKAMLLDRIYPVPADVEGYFKRWYPDANILTKFMLTRNHGNDAMCDGKYYINDIRYDRYSLRRMFEHLEGIFTGRFSREDSDLYDPKKHQLN